ncbi:MAG: caspase family protein [Gammaproteobacteria bacterium]|nr:caspase family protein [Gammaproteobacteria bacterium]
MSGISLYTGSYALLIGVSDYTRGWPDLESVPFELERVETQLQEKGFTIVKRLNPDSGALKRAFEKFIGDYGYDTGNRLLFFFSGHGHTRDNNRKGYLVPTDAPNPEADERGFLRKALPMSQIIAWSRQFEAKHALFVFDSCFSGTVFKEKSIAHAPKHISRSVALPVRQFITAGSAGETVPAQSVFVPAFIDALKYGWGDLNKDGYITGMELGYYLQTKVPGHVDQSPQFGKIRDYELSRGDYVFLDKARQGQTAVIPLAPETILDRPPIPHQDTIPTPSTPRVAVLFAENFTESGMSGKTAQQRIVEKVKHKGLKVVRLSSAQQKRIEQEPSLTNELATSLRNKVEFLVVGRAVVRSTAGYRGSELRPRLATLEYEVVRTRDGEIMVSGEALGKRPHIDEWIGGKAAIKQAADSAWMEIAQAFE